MYIHFIFIFFFINAISAIVMQKDEILHMNITQYDNQSFPCPEYSLGFHNDIACSFRFICLENECHSVTNNTTYLEFTKDGETFKYISNYCSVSSVQRNECTTDRCTSDSDCISNKCINNICMEGDTSPFTECRDRNKSDYNKKEVIMTCGKLEGEKCQNDNECAGKCYSENPYFIIKSKSKENENDEEEVDRCHAFSVKPNAKDGVFLWYGIYSLVIIIILILLILTIGILLCCCCCCCGHSNYKHKK